LQTSTFLSGYNLSTAAHWTVKIKSFLLLMPIYWVEFVQKARFKKLACLCHIKQNDLTYLGRVRLVYPCLPGSTANLSILRLPFLYAFGLVVHKVPNRDKNFKNIPQ